MIPLFKFKIQGNSMLPAFKSGETVLVNRLAYFFRTPKVGDIVVLKKERYIIKRIVKIKDDRFFVVGDNKKESMDSKRFGWIDRKDIVGKVLIKI